MIQIIGWRVRVPESEYRLGYVGDHLVRSVMFRLDGTKYLGWLFKLDIEHSGIKDILDLEKAQDSSGITLTLDVDSSFLNSPGTITAQIRAYHPDGRTRHTNKFNFYIQDSVAAEKAFSKTIPTEFRQIEERVTELRDETEEFALRAEAAAGIGGQSAVVHQFPSHLEFPNIGQPGSVYIDSSANKTYRWDSAEARYYVIGSDYEQIKVIYGGTA